MKAIINARIYDYHQYIDNGYILFDRQIISVGSMSDFKGHYEVFDAQGKLIIPGLLNGHTHIYSSLFRGSPLITSPNTFTEVLEQTWWHFDSKLDLDSIRTSAYAYGIESLEHGVTSMIDHHASSVVEGSLLTIDLALNDLDIKHLLCFETSDRFDVDLAIAENEYALQRGGHFGMHASMSLSDETLNLVADTLRNRPIHIHVAESIDDVKDAKEKYGTTIIDRLNKLGLLNEDSIFGHCVHITDAEADLIKKSNGFIAINPTSNLNNAVGLYNAKLINEHRLNILVGTDGLGVNVAKEYQYLYYLGKQQMHHPSKLSLDFVKKAITDGYHYFNRRSGQRIGRLAPNYAADFVMIDYNYITPMNENNIFAHLLFGVFDGFKPYAVYTNGKKQIDQYKYINERRTILEDVNRLWGKL